jgi:hypothetical protein
VREPHRFPVARTLGATALLVLALIVLSPGAARAAPVAPGPLSLSRQLLSNLSAPSVGPGSSTTVTFRLLDPPSFYPLQHGVVTFALYALNGYPGSSPGALPPSDAPVLENSTASAFEVNVTVGALGLGASFNGSLRVLTSSATPTGTYAIRTAVSFTADGSDYRFESRGWFNESTWENATVDANGTATVNASRLGVSGIVPETAVYVAPSDWPVALAVLTGVGLAVVGLGAWLYFRRGPRSRSGTGNAEPPGATKAPSAFGSSRSSPGDSRSS